MNPISAFIVSLPKRNQIGKLKLSQLCKKLIDRLNQSSNVKFNEMLINQINIGKETQNFGEITNIIKNNKVDKNQKNFQKEEISQKINDKGQESRRKYTADKNKQGETFQKPSETVKNFQNAKKQTQKPPMSQTSKNPSPMKGSFQASQKPASKQGQSSQLGPPPSQGYYSEADRYDEQRSKQNPASNPKNICLEDKDNQYQEQKICNDKIVLKPSKHGQSFASQQCQDHEKGQSKHLKECQDALSHVGKTRYQKQSQESLNYTERAEQQPYPPREQTIKKVDEYSSSGEQVNKPLPEKEKASSQSDDKNEDSKKTSERFQQKQKDQKQIKQKTANYPKDNPNPQKQSASFSTSKTINSTNISQNQRIKSRGPFDKKTQIPEFQSKKQINANDQITTKQDDELQLKIMTNWNAQSGQTNSINQDKQSEQQGELIYKIDPFMRDKKLQEEGKVNNLTEQDPNKLYDEAYTNIKQKSKEQLKNQNDKEKSVKKQSTSKQFKQVNKQVNQTTIPNQNMKFKFSTSNKAPKDTSSSKNPNKQKVKDQLKGTDYDKSFTDKVKDKADQYLHVSQYYASGQQQNKDEKTIKQKIKQKADQYLKTDENKNQEDKTMTQKVKQTIKQKVDDMLGTDNSDKKVGDQAKQKIQQKAGEYMADKAKDKIKDKAYEYIKQDKSMYERAKQTVKEKVDNLMGNSDKTQQDKTLLERAGQTIKQKTDELLKTGKQTKETISNYAQKVKQKVNSFGMDKQSKDDVKKDQQNPYFNERKPTSDPFNKTYEGLNQNISKEDSKKTGVDEKDQVGKNVGKGEVKSTKQTKNNQTNQNKQSSNKATKPNQFKFSTKKDKFNVDNADNTQRKVVNDFDKPHQIQQPLDKPNQGKYQQQRQKQVIEGKQNKKQAHQSNKDSEKDSKQSQKQSSKDRDLKEDQTSNDAKRSQNQIPSYNKFTTQLLSFLILKKKDFVV